MKISMDDAVNHPKHYNKHPSGVECIDIIEHMTHNAGAAVKYLWRAGLKDSAPLVQDLEKARWYIEREIARLALTVGRYSTMRATTDLRNWLGFCTLRMAPNAQWEIREYANVVGKLIEAKFPLTWAMFAESLSG